MKVTCLKILSRGTFEDGPHKNFPKMYAAILLVKSVKLGGFEDIVTNFYFSGM